MLSEFHIKCSNTNGQLSAWLTIRAQTLLAFTLTIIIVLQTKLSVSRFIGAISFNCIYKSLKRLNENFFSNEAERQQNKISRNLDMNQKDPALAGVAQRIECQPAN